MKSFVLQGCAHPTLSLSSLPSSLLTLNMVLLRQLFSTEHWSIDGTADLGTFYVRTCIRRAAASRKGSAPWPTGNYNWWLAQTYHSRSHFLIYPVHDRKNQPRELVLRTRLLGLLHLDPCCLLSTGSLAAAAAGNLLTTKLVAWIDLKITSMKKASVICWALLSLRDAFAWRPQGVMWQGRGDESWSHHTSYQSFYISSIFCGFWSTSLSLHCPKSPPTWKTPLSLLLCQCTPRIPEFFLLLFVIWHIFPSVFFFGLGTSILTSAD